MQNPVDEVFVLVVAEPLDERRGGEGDAHPVGGQAVLGEAVVEEGGYGDFGGAELFLLLDEVGAADEADGDVVAEGAEEGEHGRRDGLVRGLLAVCFA